MRRRLVAAILILTFLITGIIMFISPIPDGVPVVAETSVQKTLVIDAGHGGFDGGASGASGVTEQDINLSIAQRTQQLCAFWGYETLMTRADDQALDYQPGATIRQNKVADLHKRLEILQQTPDPILLSVHLNYFSDAQYKGAQVFYSTNHAQGESLAKALQQTLKDGLDPENNRQAKAAPDGVYLLKQAQCPAVIIECGFLSNPQEEELLTQEDYHKRIALCILAGVQQYFSAE